MPVDTSVFRWWEETPKEVVQPILPVVKRNSPLPIGTTLKDRLQYAKQKAIEDMMRAKVGAVAPSKSPWEGAQ